MPPVDQAPDADKGSGRPLLSVIIKTLNEAKNIERTIQSALRVSANGDIEVIVADSLSTDATVEIASRFPVLVVQLCNPADRRCGVGPQLGFQHAHGEYIWLVDGDMELNPDFAHIAIGRLSSQSSLAGVGGLIHEMSVLNYEFERRSKAKAEPSSQSEQTFVRALEGGGVYRRAAIESVGYLSDRNLHSYEEYELGLRLRNAGWTLARLSVTACFHYGHASSSYALLWRRFRSRYAYGAGEVLRAGAQGGASLRVVAELREVRLWMGLAAFEAVLMTSLFWTPVKFWPALLIAAALPFAAALIKARGLHKAVFTFASWHVFTAGFILGVFAKRKDPTARIVSRTVSNDLVGWRRVSSDQR